MTWFRKSKPTKGCKAKGIIKRREEEVRGDRRKCHNEELLDCLCMCVKS